MLKESRSIPFSVKSAGYSTFLPLSSAFLSLFSFPPVSFSLLIFGALLPLLVSSFSMGWKQAFRQGFITGFIFFSCFIWWIAPAISVYGRMPYFAAWPVMFLLSSYLALFYGTWTGVWGWLTRIFNCTGLLQVLLLSLSMSGLWVLIEFVRGNFIFGGFPWGLFAYALAPFPFLIQSAEIWGCYGITFLVVLINILFSFFFFLSGCSGKRDWTIIVFIGFAALMLNFSLRAVAIEKDLSGSDATPLFVAALQGSFNQDIKWNRDIVQLTLDRYEHLGLTIEKKTIPPDVIKLIVWPETSLPFYFQEQTVWRDKVLSIVKKHDAYTLTGGQSYSYSDNNTLSYMNSAFFIDPEGDVIGRYDKVHLVPFGEYLPFEKYFRWVRNFMPTAGNFVSGTGKNPLVAGNIRLGIQICFESIFPEISRKAVLNGANILAVITNDAWFGRTGAPYQHADIAVLRAVETGRWLIRAANTGISEIISPSGHVIVSTELFKPDAIGISAELKGNTTFYVEHGDGWLLCFCVLLQVVMFLAVIQRSVRTICSVSARTELSN